MADNNQKIYVTEEGLKKLQEEYDELIHVTREQVKEQLKEARSLGDLSENADYDAARERQAEVEKDIQEHEYKLKNYELIKAKTTSRVSIGSTVTLRFLDTDEVETYEIVGTTEADPDLGKISNDCMLAKCILDKKSGQTVEVTAKKPYKVVIEKIK